MGSKRLIGGIATSALIAALAVTASGPSSASSAPTGEPIKVMVWGPVDTPQPPEVGLFPTAEVAAAAINDRGGINGRPIEVITCDEKFDPNEAERCARQAVSENVLAVVGSYSFSAARYMPILEAAGIPYVGGRLFSAEDSSSPMSYPIDSGTQVLFAGLGVLAAQSGCANPSYLQADIQGAEYLTEFVRQGLQSGGVDSLEVIRTSISGGDLSSQAAAATTGDIDCVISGVGVAPNINFLRALQQLGGDQQFITCSSCIDGAAIEQTGGASGPLEGALLVGASPSAANPGFDEFKAAIEQYGEGDDAENIDVSRSAPQGMWISFVVLETVANTIEGEVTPATLIEALNTSEPIDTGGLTPPLSWSPTLEIPGLERLPNAAVRYMTITDAEIVDADDEFHDLIDVITPAA